MRFRGCDHHIRLPLMPILESEANNSMREIIPTRLWIGNATDARNFTGVLGLGIAAIVDLAVEEPPIQFSRGVES